MRRLYHVERRLRLLFLAFYFGGFVLLGSCTAPVTVRTPQGHVAYTADQIVLRLNELETAAIQANATGGLPLAITKRIVEFCVTADKTLKALPTGWQASVSAAWNETKDYLGSFAKNPSMSAAIAAVDLVVASLGGGS